jgi:hypothetical protein
MSINLTEVLFEEVKLEVLKELRFYPYVLNVLGYENKVPFHVDQFYSAAYIKLGLDYLMTEGRWDGLVDFVLLEKGVRREEMSHRWLYPFIQYMVEEVKERFNRPLADGSDMMRYAELLSCIGVKLRERGVHLFM